MENRKSYNFDMETVQLPKDFFPECWTDDIRAGVLFSPFRNRLVNPENYDGKMKFWQQLIEKYCIVKGSGDVTITELRVAFKRNELMPYCLETVVDNMLKLKQVQNKNKFMELPKLTWSGWAISTFIKLPISWSYQQLLKPIVNKSLGSAAATTEAADDTNTFIVVEVIEKQAMLLLKHFENLQLYPDNHNNNVLLLDDIYNNLNDSGLTKTGAELCLHYLICQQKADRKEFQNSKKQIITLIKLQYNNNNMVEPITKIDYSIYELNITINDLLKLIENYDNEIIKIDKTVREAIKEGKRNVAKQHLKQKHRTQKIIDQKTNELENLQILLQQIETTIHNVNIKETYDLATNTLKLTLGDINIDDVDETVDNIRETLENVDEIQNTLGNASITTAATNDLTDTELEQELMDLMKEEPSPPKHDANDTSAKEELDNDQLINEFDKLKLRITTTDDEKNKILNHNKKILLEGEQ